MAQKKVVGKAKLQIIGGSANPAPPVGPTLSSLGVNIMQFCQSFNSATSNRKGEVVPVIITAYRDASFDFVTLEPPVSALIKEAAGLDKASSDALRIICSIWSLELFSESIINLLRYGCAPIITPPTWSTKLRKEFGLCIPNS